MSDLFLPEALADLFVRSGLLLLLAWAAAAAIGKAGAPAASRHLVWLHCLAALLLLPLLSAVLPALPLPILPAENVPVLPMAVGPSAAPAFTAEPFDFRSQLAWTIYGLAAAAIAARLLLGRLLLASHWRRANADPGLESQLDQLRSQLGIMRRVHLRLSPDPAMPITWGWANPRILLPADAASWSEERRRLVLLHELAHVSRFDSPVRLAAGLACALYWFQPIIWFAVRKLRIEQEHAADDLVLAAGAGPKVYAFSLLEVAGGRAPRMGSLYAAMAGPSELERRLAAIVAPGARGGPGRFFAAATIVAASASALFAATAMPVAALPANVVPVTLVQPARAESAVMPAHAVVPPAVGRSQQPSAVVAPAEAFSESLDSAAIDVAAAPATDSVPTVPVVPVVPFRPAALELGFEEPDSERAVEAYRRERSVYRLQRREYHEQLSEYHRQLKAHHGQVAALRREGNLGNSGNDGNAGNVGNEGNEGGPGYLPTLPTAPTPPTPPTPPMPIYRHIASAETAPSSQGP